MPNLRNFFLKRAQLATKIEQVYFALIALKMTSNVAPFLQLANAKEIDIGQTSQASAIYQFYDMMNNPVPFKNPLEEVAYISAYGSKKVLRNLENTFKQEEGKLTV